jgi:hypothetical protein
MRLPRRTARYYDANTCYITFQTQSNNSNNNAPSNLFGHAQPLWHVRRHTVYMAWCNWPRIHAALELNNAMISGSLLDHVLSNMAPFSLDNFCIIIAWLSDLCTHTRCLAIGLLPLAVVTVEHSTPLL